MCGLNGAFAYHPAAPSPPQAEILATRDHMRRRGPDGAGAWRSPDGRCALGHRRLSIIDLSAAASQPMVSEDEALTIVFNGEIYNFPKLKADLERVGVVFRTRSDTEALLHLYRRYGADMVDHLRGMYALAIWDARREGLFLARDPYGIKPLYTANDGWTFRFASQVKALLAGGGVSRDPEAAGVVGFHLMGSVPEPFTLYREVRALPAGHRQWIDRLGPREPEPFASISQALRPTSSSAVELDEAVRSAVLDSVQAHLLADVEVGLFLSAGVDSGALLGLMRDAGQSKVRAITLAFEEFAGTEEDEAPLAAQVAQAYGADHHVRRVGRDEFERDLPDILEAMDQPSIDGVNTWFVSKAASEAGLKVALSGLGGDEILAGYPSFRDIPRWVRWMRVPGAVPGLGQFARVLARGAGLKSKAAGMAEYGGDFAGAYLLRRAVLMPYDLKDVLSPDVVRQGLERLDLRAALSGAITPDPGQDTARVAALEAQNYMRNQLLRDADWAGMAHSLEIRTPLVDYDLLRRVGPLMPQMAGGRGKEALARSPSIPLPRDIVERRKTGFGVPMGRWLSGATGRDGASRRAESRSWGGRVLQHQGLAA